MINNINNEYDLNNIDNENNSDNSDDYLDIDIDKNDTKGTTINVLKSNFTDPNIYLKLDPIKSIQSNIARNINYDHVIITRFSYRFKLNSSTNKQLGKQLSGNDNLTSGKQLSGNDNLTLDKLFNEERLQMRFKLFETFCLPSVLSQINPNFYWIIIIDPELPTQYSDILYKHIAKFYTSNLYATRGPRQIFVHRWLYNTTLANISWINALIPLKCKYLVTTRLDDDDCISRDFTNHIADTIRLTQIKGFKLISYSNGFYWYKHHDLEYGIFKPINKPFIAIGLSFIVEREKYPMTVYFGSHTRLLHHIKNWKEHSMLRKFIEASNDSMESYTKYEIIRKKSPVYIRSVHDFNLQKSEKNEYSDKTISDNSSFVHNFNLICQHFTINQTLLQNLNSK